MGSTRNTPTVVSQLLLLSKCPLRRYQLQLQPSLHLQSDDNGTHRLCGTFHLRLHVAMLRVGIEKQPTNK